MSTLGRPVNCDWNDFDRRAPGVFRTESRIAAPTATDMEALGYGWDTRGDPTRRRPLSGWSDSSYRHGWGFPVDYLCTVDNATVVARDEQDMAIVEAVEAGVADADIAEMIGIPQPAVHGRRLAMGCPGGITIRKTRRQDAVWHLRKQGFSLVDISKALSISLGTVVRSVQNLRSEIEGLDSEPK